MSDLISRADAIEAVANMLYEEAPYLDTEVKCYKYAEKLINALPSADAVHGEWIEREDWNGDYYYDCSVCGESFVLFDGTPSMNLYHYCPNCGARNEKIKIPDDKGGDTE